MARTKPSEADMALIAEVRKRGFSATPTQLERWREQVWLPRNPREWLGQGRGSSSGLRPETVDRAVWLAAISRPGRSLGVVGWVFWALNDNKASAKRLRAALLTALDRPFTRAGITEIPDGDSDEAFQVREEAASRLLKGRRAPQHDFDRTLREYAAEAGCDLPHSPFSVPNMYHRALLEPGARMMVGGTDHVSFDEILDSWETAWPHHAESIEALRAFYRDAEFAGADAMAQSPMADGMAGLRRAVEDAGDPALCAAVRTCTKASGTLAELLKRAIHEPVILTRLMNHVMWDQWVRTGGVLVDGQAGEAAVALSTVQFLIVPGWAEDLERYLAFMEALLLVPRTDAAFTGQ
ncbi:MULTISPECIES: hypothetical protein [Streptomyces]|uniref:hypothetical protein n=1 Tax=Streptomyces TaxID=1883 RepID=UPI002ECFDC42|nr:hypothetical protein OHB17_42945 [Streptomyces sp. NBC_00724]